MDDSLMMWLGVWFGVLAGIGGGLFGTYMSIRNTNGPKERAFMVKSSVVIWLSILVFLALLYLIPLPYNFLLWLPYGGLVLCGIRYCNKKQNEIRESERLA